MRLRLASAREYEQKQRLSVVKGKTTDLPAGSAVDDVNELVAPPISGGFECRDAIAEVLFVAVLRPKDEFANARVEPIGADDEVKPPFGAMLELDMYLAARLAQRDQARDQLEDARRRHTAEFNAMRLEWQALRERERDLEATLLPVVRQRTEALLAGYSSGQVSLLNVLEARRAEVDARVQVLDLERDAARLWAKLRYTYLDSAGAKP